MPHHRDNTATRRPPYMVVSYRYMSDILLSLATFWIAIAVGTVVTRFVIPILRRTGTYKRSDRKRTLYGTEAREFANIRTREEGSVKKKPVPRMGGVTILPTIVLIGSLLAWFRGSDVLFLSVLTISAAVLVMLYDDLTDIGIVKRKPLRIRDRFLCLAALTGFAGLGFAFLIPDGITFLPFDPFMHVAVGPVGMAALFTAWCIFWQASSVIDGIDGLAGSVFLVLFSGTAIVSVLQGDGTALLLSAVGLGVIVPWLFANYAPAKAYLTETGITALIMLFAIITFLLGTGADAGDGLWVGGIFGSVLIATWASIVLQMLYRKRTGRKLFRITPLHHHFEAIGLPGSSVVLRYMLITFLSVMLGISCMLAVQAV